MTFERKERKETYSSRMVRVAVMRGTEEEREEARQLWARGGAEPLLERKGVLG